MGLVFNSSTLGNFATLHFQKLCGSGGEICFFDVNTHKGHWTVGWSGWGGGGGMSGSVLRPA